jgi:hypothetical protein
MTASIEYRVTARNTARASPNKMHDDEIAKTYGFTDGLVPGVTTFAWMCAPAFDLFGDAWLECGGISARFIRPIYEGDDVLIEGVRSGDELALTVSARDGICATGTAMPVAAVEGGGSPSRHPLPSDPPPADRRSLAPGIELGTVEATLEAARARQYLTSIDADHPLPARVGVAHPGWLLLLANLALSNNVRLGPWIHVSSDVRLEGAVADGENVSALSRVTGEYERKGHRFVELDVRIVAAGTRPAATIRHVAIYEPRPVL